MSRSLSRPSSFRRGRGSWPITFLVMAAIAFAAPSVFAAGPFVKLSGTVTNSLSGAGVAGATVTFANTSATFTLTTDANGNYATGGRDKVQVGTYTMGVTAPTYTDSSQPVSLNKGTAVVNVALVPVARVIVTAGVTGDAVPGGSLEATGSCLIMDGSTLISSGWSQGAEGLPATIGSGNTATVSLQDVTAYAAHLIEVLQDPPITAADLPPDLVLQPINEIRKGLQDRYQVVAIDPMAMEHAEALPLTFTCTTSSGTYKQAVSETVELPWVVSTGVKTVPVSAPVLLLAKCGPPTTTSECSQTTFNWSITGAPNGSAAFLTDDDTRSPWFTPDNPGKYTIQQTTPPNLATIEVFVGRYHGVIDPVATLDSVLFGDGRPVADENCTNCHSVGEAAPANFDTWRNTGHAEAFTQGITTNSHFGESCFACHALGYGLDGPLDPGGIDDTPSYPDFLADLDHAQHGGDISTLWITMLTDQPDTARLSNIQCENCHGPQDHTAVGGGDGAHKDQPGAPRVNLGSEVCGSCHGEPARHGRYQQWQLSNHADYDLARSRGASSGNCARCHSGNGFVAWSELDFDPVQNVTVTWDQDTVVPQTCAACHNPHDTGTTSGSDGTNARVRVNSVTGGTCGSPDCDTYELTAGFMASNVGKGATCMTCHNSRAGVPRNDGTWASLSTSEKTGSPHHGVQADLVMGENLYFTGSVSTPGNHALIEDVCVTCHMNATQPPDILSYNQTGTNHTFAADPGICVQCHGLAGETLAAQVDTEITGYLDDLKTELGDGWMRLLIDNYPVNVSGCGVADNTNPITAVEWVYSRGTRLNITVNGITCSNLNPSSQVSTGGGSGQDLGLAANDGALYKAAWNYGLNFEDETINGCVDADDPNCDPPHTHRGVHNHDFSQEGLLGAISAVQSVSP